MSTYLKIGLFFLLSIFGLNAQNLKKEYYDTATQYGYKEDWKNAILYINKVIEVAPKDSTAYFQRAIFKEAIKDYKGAIEDYTIQGKINPSEPDNFFLRGIDRQKIKDYKNATADYNTTIKMEPDNPDAYRFRGQIKEIKKNYLGALKDYNKALSIRPYSNAFYDRAKLYYKLKNYKKALHDFNNALEIDSTIVDAYRLKGVIELRNKEYKTSLISFTKAIQLAPSNKQLFLKRAEVNVYLKNQDAACSDYKQYKKLGGSKIININCK